MKNDQETWKRYNNRMGNQKIKKMKIVLVGSSPAMLLQALILAKKNNNVQVFEKENRLGGSWKTSDFYNIKNIETGTHIFAPWKNAKLYFQSKKFLETKLKLKTFFLKPQPVRIINKHITRKELAKIKYFNIRGGANQLVKNLISLIKKKKIKIFFNKKIKKVLVDSRGKKRLILCDKSSIEADKIYLPLFLDLTNFYYSKKKRYVTNFKSKVSKHLVIELLNKKIRSKRKLTYIQKANFSKFIDRVCKFNFKNKTIYCLRLSEIAKRGLKESKKKQIHLIYKDLLNFLFQKKYDGKKINFRAKIYTYNSSYRNIENAVKLKTFTKLLGFNLIDTSEIIKYISQNIKQLNDSL